MILIIAFLLFWLGCAGLTSVKLYRLFYVKTNNPKKNKEQKGQILGTSLFLWPVVWVFGFCIVLGETIGGWFENIAVAVFPKD